MSFLNHHYPVSLRDGFVKDNPGVVFYISAVVYNKRYRVGGMCAQLYRGRVVGHKEYPVLLKRPYSPHNGSNHEGIEVLNGPDLVPVITAMSGLIRRLHVDIDKVVFIEGF